MILGDFHQLCFQPRFDFKKYGQLEYVTKVLSLYLHLFYSQLSEYMLICKALDFYQFLFAKEVVSYIDSNPHFQEYPCTISVIIYTMIMHYADLSPILLS